MNKTTPPLPLYMLQKEGNKESPLHKAGKQFNDLISELTRIETVIKEQNAQKAAAHNLFLEKCLPAFVQLSNTKLAMLRRAEQLLQSGKYTPAIALKFCTFVSLFSNEVKGFNEQVAAFAAIYDPQLLATGKAKSISGVVLEEEDYKESQLNENDFQNRKRQKQKDSNQKRQTFKKKTENSFSAVDFTSIPIQNFYLILAKALHPDLEKQESRILEKVKLMQDLNEAKIKKDLFAMLLVQQKAAPYLEEGIVSEIFTLNRLKIFNKILKEKILQNMETIEKNDRESFSMDSNGYLQKKTMASVNKKTDQVKKQLKKLNKDVQTDMYRIKNWKDMLTFIDYYIAHC